MKSSYEGLGIFYLGREYDMKKRAMKQTPLLYDSKDLTTHAVIIGMTGSGKTGLGIGILEEALIDGIPVIAIDPKGDIPNLMLTFPELRPSDFLPWISRQEALNKGLNPEEYARKQASLWKKGLAEWDQGPDRIAKLKSAADFTVYTPGSSAGRKISVLRRLCPPPAPVLEEADLLKDKIQNSVTSLLSLLGIEADPLTSKEHILLSNIIDHFWSQGRTINLVTLIKAIQSPPFSRIGIMDLELFYPEKERFSLSMRLNNLLAAPGFEAWLEGDPMDIQSLFYTPQGGPRASIFTISHLSEEERLFFVSMLLNEIIGWMRMQSGTGSLRAILYMDEIFGYFPPVKNPPTKRPLLTLLKQARAYGLGVVLSTQNPVDLDYKGLSNTGTWFIGRLQTERDKLRVLEGLEGAASGSNFDASEMGMTLASLEKRVFLLHNVHEPKPVTFHTRWALSYLSGPLTREQIRMLNRLEDPDRSFAKAQEENRLPHGSKDPERYSAEEMDSESSGPPMLPSDINVWYLSPSGAGRQGLIYMPALIGRASIYYQNTKMDIEVKDRIHVLAPLQSKPGEVDWDGASVCHFEPEDLEKEPVPGAIFESLPPSALRSSSYRKWAKEMLKWIRLNRPIRLFKCRKLKAISLPGEKRSEFRARLSQMMRERRDIEIERLRNRYAKRFGTLKDRLLRAEQAIEREEEQAKTSKFQTAISFGTALLGAFFGRKALSSTSVSRMGTAMRSASRMRKEKMDVERAIQRAEQIGQQIQELEEKLDAEIAKIEERFNPELIEIEEKEIRARANSISLDLFGLVWLPYRRNTAGGISPDWE